MGFRKAALNLRQIFSGQSARLSIIERLDQVQSISQHLDQMQSITQRLDQMQLQLDRLERMSHGGRATYVGKNRILTKCVIADAIIGFLVEADDRLLTPWLTLSGEYELDLTNFFLKNLKRNSKCLDVGANFGFFTCLMARFCHQGKVIGIEPNQHVYELLRDNIYINGFQGHAIPKHAAISDLVGTLTLHRRITRSGNTSIQKPDQAFLDVIGEQTSESFQIVCLRVDDLLPEFRGAGGHCYGECATHRRDARGLGAADRDRRGLAGHQ